MMKLLTRIALSICIILMCNFAYSQDNSPFVRFTALNPDGSQIAFSYQGDIWTMPVSGGKAQRLTIHAAYEGNPKWSPDGSKIAFSSNRFGNNDVFVISAQGGKPKRMTFHSSNDNLSDWTKDNRLLFTTSRNFRQVEWETEIHEINAIGGTPKRLLDAVGMMPSASPNGKLIAFVIGYNKEQRYAYTGSCDKEIWIFNSETKNYTKVSTFAGNDMQPRWGDDNTLYFVSAQSGKYNIYRMKLNQNGKKQGDNEQLTKFDADGVRYFDVSKDGKTLVMEVETAIFIMPTNGGEAKKVAIEIATDYRFDPIEHKIFTKDISEYSVSPNGKQVALVIRGEIFVSSTDKEKKRTVQITDHPFNDKNVAWLNDTTLIFSSDRNGQYDLYMARSVDSKKSNLLKTLKREIIRITNTPENEIETVISPNSKKIVYKQNRGILITADISLDGKLSNQKTLLDAWATPENFSWSPDSKWLAYELEDLNFNSEIYIHAADNSSKAVNISMHPRADYSPVWSKDGSKLGFISTRNNSDDDVWFVWLKKEDWEKTKQDWDDFDDDEQEKEGDKEDKKDEEDDKKEIKPILIDFKNIHQRLKQVTALPGNEANLAISADGETLFFTTNGSGRTSSSAKSDLYSIKWDGTDQKALTTDGKEPYRVSLEANGKQLYMLKKGGSLSKMEIDGSKMEAVSFSAKMNINYPQERKQIFEEAWRTLNMGFYDPQFHGKDWTKLKVKYKPWIEKTSTDKDFTYVMNLMLGELNASHMGFYGKDRAKTQREKTGLLGIEIEPLANGIRITNIIENTPASRKNSKLKAGDIITAVNGSPVNSKSNFYEPFLATTNEKVILTLVDGREVIIRPTASLRDALYEQWVNDRKTLTDKYSGGRLGYIHIRGMNWTSFERFERELMASGYGKEGIVIDVRFNGGGWTTDYLMTILSVKQHAYTVPRGAAKDLEKENSKFKSYYPYGERLPFSAVAKPSIALCNEYSYSNAEIFSHAYKHLGLGTLVGQPTFGAVISTSGRQLLGEHYVRLPFRGWYVSATGKNMETDPAVPDILVQNAPNEKAKGKDMQLKKSVEELLKQIGK